MATIKERLKALEQASQPDELPPLVVIYEDSPTPEQQAQMNEANAKGQRVIIFKADKDG